MPNRKIPDREILIKHVITNMTNTPFDNKHVRRLINKYIVLARDKTQLLNGVDPFARESFTTLQRNWVTNDINETMPTDYHLEANEFAVRMYTDAQSFSICLFDPPYTLRMLKDHYLDENNKVNETIPLWQTHNMWGDAKNYLGKCIEVGGYVISFGYHTHGFGKHRGFEKREILICEQSGSPDRYDILIVVEQKVQHVLFQSTKS